MANDYTGLLSGENWGGIEVTGKPTIVTFSFPTTAPAYDATIDDPNLTPAAKASFQAFNAAEQAMARTALNEWASNSGLIFIEVAPGAGDINFQKLDFTGTGYAGAGGIGYHPFGDWQFGSYPYFTSDLDSSGDVFMNSAIAVNYGTLLHEIGHAIGLKHPTEVWTDYAANPPVTHNVWTADDPSLTIMSQLSGGTGHLTSIDVQAVQSIYGTNAQDGAEVASWSFNAAKQTLTQTGFSTADAIRGTSVIDVLNGGAGDDKLFGLNGADTLNGGDGNDLLDGGPGADKMNGGKGDDTYFVSVAGDKITEAANQGYDSVISTVTYKLTDNVEQLQFWGDAKVTGTGNALGNVIYGNDAGDTLNGGAGDDYIVGGAGADKIGGGTENDQLYGLGGADKITGGGGDDYMEGGGGADVFSFAGMSDFGTGLLDRIGDFSHGQKDKIDLKAIDANPLASGDQAFAFIGAAAFNAASGVGQVRYVVSGSDVQVQIDINHDHVADASFWVSGVAGLVAGDFTL